MSFVSAIAAQAVRDVFDPYQESYTGRLQWVLARNPCFSSDVPVSRPSGARMPRSARFVHHSVRSASAESPHPRSPRLKLLVAFERAITRPPSQVSAPTPALIECRLEARLGGAAMVVVHAKIVPART